MPCGPSLDLIISLFDCSPSAPVAHMISQLSAQNYCVYSSDNTVQEYASQYDYAAGQYSLYYSYAEPEYVPFEGGSGPVPYEQDASSQLPLHAPVPISTYTTLLADPTGDATDAFPYYPSLDAQTFAVEETKPLIASQENPPDLYLNALIPTPSEVLNDPNSRDRGPSSDAESADRPSPKAVTVAGSSTGKRKRHVQEKSENLNQRKAYFRSVSDNVGFTITDPDKITSHDKKRSYLECLEEYVQFLHERIQIDFGQRPLALERISTYRGLKNRSLRTILVHKQRTLRKLHMQKLAEEQRFMDLHNAVLMRQATEDAQNMRRHSIAMGAMPSGVVPSFASR